MSGLGKVVRALVGIAVVVVLLGTVNAWYRDYKTASRVKAGHSSSAATRTVDTASVVAVRGQKVAILVDGLSLRSTPDTSTKVIRPLKRGEQLLLVGITQTNWLQLRDNNGKLGFIVNNAQTVKVQK